MEFEDGYRLTEEEIQDAGPVLEAGPSIVVPERGGVQRNVFEWDGQTQEGTVKLAVIRPCVSRGKRIRGLPPIYTEQMLAENAGVYTNWLMYMDHLPRALREAIEEISEELQESRSRLTSELGGRIIRSWWSPDYRAGWDDDRGFRPGAVMAEALPQPVARKMLEADPLILNVSHNAWPKGAVVGTHFGQKGAIIEGIRREPEGSVDWVPRAGAGGQLAEGVEEVAVSVFRSHYDARPVSRFANIKDPDALVEAMEKEAPELLESMGGAEAVRKLAKERPGGPAPAATGGITIQEVEQLLDAKLQDRPTQETVQEAAERIIEERAASQEIADYAIKLIEGSGLPAEWQASFRPRYCVLPSGPSAAIKLAEDRAEKAEDEADQDPKVQIKKIVEADLRQAVSLIESSGGAVRVKGLTAEKPDPEGDGKDPKTQEEQSQWVADIGGLGPVPEGKKDSDLISEMLAEGMEVG